MTSTLKFRKISTGLYGTSLRREPMGLVDGKWPGAVEVAIHYMSDVWWIREVTFEGNLTSHLGASFGTLRDAKAYLTRCMSF
jgi:hypothetical protein